MRKINWNKELKKFYQENKHLDIDKISFKFVTKFCNGNKER